MTIDLSTCQPGQELRRIDGLKATYIQAFDDGEHLLDVHYYSGSIKRHYKSDGGFSTYHSGHPTDIAIIVPLQEPPIEPVWKASISDDHVEATSGFWAVYQGKVT